MAQYSNQLEFAKELVREGGLIAKKAQHHNPVSYSLKPNERAHIVTKYDKEIEETLIKHIKDNFPSHSIYGEETGTHDNSSDFTWLIDPIDGTSNYSHGLPLYCTMLALMHHDQVVVAAIYLPELDELFYAQIGHGAFVNGTKLHVSTKANLEEIFMYVERGGKEHDQWYVNLLSNSQHRIMGTRILGSCGIQMAYIAAGRMDALISKGCKLYDRAPGMLFIKEAGGTILNFKGEKHSYKETDIIAGNETLAHKIAKELLL